MKVFVDTSALVALLVENEQFHSKVTSKYANYRQKRAVLFTSYYILDELFTRLTYYNIDIMEHIKKLKNSIVKNELTVLSVNENMFNKSIDIFLKFSEHKISFTDATSYVLCKEFSMDEVFTLDKDFKRMRLKTSF
jgi:uncharacterized protein